MSNSKELKKINLIKKKDMPKEFEVLGKTRLDKAKFNEKDVIIINGEAYSSKIKDDDKLLGYVKVEEDNDEDNRYYEIYGKKSILIPLFLIFFGLIAIVLVIIICFCKKPTDEPPKNELIVADGGDIKDIPEPEQTDYTEYIELPYLSTVSITDKVDFVPLANPEGNTVYMKFTVKDVDNNEVIFSNDEVVAPGEFIKWFPKEYFKDKGEYKILFNIQTFDVVDSSDCSGANIDSVLTIN